MASGRATSYGSVTISERQIKKCSLHFVLYSIQQLQFVAKLPVTEHKDINKYTKLDILVGFLFYSQSILVEFFKLIQSERVFS